MAKKKKQDEESKAENRALMAPTDMASALLEDAGMGMETMGVDDFAIPFVNIIQSNSGTLKKNKDGYIDGAEQGGARHGP